MLGLRIWRISVGLEGVLGFWLVFADCDFLFLISFDDRTGFDYYYEFFGFLDEFKAFFYSAYLIVDIVLEIRFNMIVFTNHLENPMI